MMQINKSISFLLLISTILFLSTCQIVDKTVVETLKVKSFVSVVHPSIQNITEYILLNGITVLQKKDIMRSTNTGYITSMKFNQGDFINAGQLFCMLGTKEQLALKNISSKDTSLNKFQHSISVIANASGIITTISFLQGDYVSEGDVLAIVSQPSSLIVQVNVPYEYHQNVGLGKPCEIILPDGEIIRTTISGALPSMDPISQSQSFIIRLSNKSLPENMNVTVRIQHVQKNNLLCVPIESVQTDEMQKEFWVMKIVNDSLAVKIPVKPGLQNDTMMEIISDKIHIDDIIIYQGAFALADSSLVAFEK